MASEAGGSAAIALLSLLSIDSTASSVSTSTARLAHPFSLARKRDKVPSIAAATGTPRSSEEKSPNPVEPFQRRYKPIFLGIPLHSHHGEYRKSATSSRPRSLGKDDEEQVVSTQAPRTFRPPDLGAFHGIKGDKPTIESPSSNPGDLMICLNAPGTDRSSLAVLQLKGFENDAALFEALRYLYKRNRGWTTSLITVKGIHYVQFEKRQSGIKVSKDPDIPPADRTDYEYHPRPAMFTPPLPSQLLTHYFRHTHANTSQNLIFRTLPKLVDSTQSSELFWGSRLESLADHVNRMDQSSRGWGIAFVEGFNWPRILLIATGYVTLNLGVLLMLGPSVELLAWLFLSLSALSIATTFGYYKYMAAMKDPVRIRPVLVAYGMKSHSSAANHTAFDSYLRVIVPIVRRTHTGWRTFLSFIIPWLKEEPSSVVSPVDGVNSDSSDQGQFARIQRWFSPRSSAVNDPITHSYQDNYAPNVEAGIPLGQRANRGGVERENDSSGDASGGDGDRDGGDGDDDHTSHGEGNDRNGEGDEGNSEDDGGDDHHDDDFDLEAADLYLHVILPDGFAAKKQVPVRVTHLSTDYHLFIELNRIYRQHRGPWRALFMVRALRPTKYELFNRTNVRTFYDPKDLPSTMPDICNRPREYTFSYQPASPVPDPPLLHEDQLTRTYHNPACSIHAGEEGPIYDQQCYDRSPKRKGKLTYTPNSGFPKGYALEFRECFDIKFILTCELFIAFVAFVLAALYFGLAKEKQKTSTAISIVAVVFLIGQFLYGVVLALGEKFEAWRF